MLCFTERQVVLDMNKNNKWYWRCYLNRIWFFAGSEAHSLGRQGKDKKVAEVKGLF
jgi:hypothetical protein